MDFVKSSWASKINWTQALAFLAMLFTMFGIDLPQDVQTEVVAGIVAGQSVLTWVLRTWFTTSITYASEPRQ